MREVNKLNELIDTLSAYEQEDRKKNLGFVPNVDSFLKYLRKINNITGLSSFKENVYSQVIGYILHYQKHGRPVNKKDMLHTLIRGPSGCGKTMIGKRLMKLWSESGILSVEEDKGRAMTDYKELCSSLKTKLNNVRKKVTASNPSQNAEIQSKFQEIKCTLVKLSSDKRFDSYIIKREGREEKKKFGVLTKMDLVGKFQGHTTAMVEKKIKEYEGGVIFVDEAYTLCTSKEDDFGMELLTEINNYMSSHPDKIIWIFAGYRENIDDGIMKFQKGLWRRFETIIDIDGYSAEELYSIMKKQMERYCKRLSDDCFPIFESKHKHFKNFGGDTKKFCKKINDRFSVHVWERRERGERLEDEDLITAEVFSQAIENFIQREEIENLTYYM